MTDERRPPTASAPPRTDAPTPNMCDGCQRGLPLVDGIHRGESPLDLIGCTAERYAPRPAPAAMAVMEAGHRLTGDYIREHFTEDDAPSPTASAPPRTEAPETRRIPQEDPMGCGVACLAMVSGRTYADVRADINPAQVEHGLADQTILWWLNRNGFWHRRSWMDGEWSYPVPMSGVALMLTHDAHWIVLVDGVVLDPARPEPLPSYDFRQAIEVRPERALVLAVDPSRSSPNEVNADAT